MIGIAPAIGLKDHLVARVGALFHTALMKQAPLCCLQADHLAAILATYMIQNHSASLRLEQKIPDHKLRKLQLRDIHEYIEANLQKSIRMNVLARIAHCSAGHFIRQFKSSTGITPHQYVMKVRVDRAKHLLAQHDSHIATVSMDCGFSSQEHMTRVFGSITGMTPGAFRKFKNGT